MNSLSPAAEQYIAEAESIATKYLHDPENLRRAMSTYVDLAVALRSSRSADAPILVRTIGYVLKDGRLLTRRLEPDFRRIDIMGDSNFAAYASLDSELKSLEMQEGASLDLLHTFHLFTSETEGIFEACFPNGDNVMMNISDFSSDTMVTNVHVNTIDATANAVGAWGQRRARGSVPACMNCGSETETLEPVVSVDYRVADEVLFGYNAWACSAPCSYRPPTHEEIITAGQYVIDSVITTAHCWDRHVGGENEAFIDDVLQAWRKPDMKVAQKVAEEDPGKMQSAVHNMSQIANGHVVAYLQRMGSTIEKMPSPTPRKPVPPRAKQKSKAKRKKR